MHNLSNRPEDIRAQPLADCLVAHRGYAARYPENSLLAVERAIAKGARYIEVDLQLTADLHPVLYHDRDMQRLSGAENKIQLLRLDELERYSLHNPIAFGDRFEDEPIPHLQQLIHLILLHPGVTFFLEFKRVSLETFGNEVFLQKTLPLLELVKHQVVLISYSPELIARGIQEGWQTGWVSNVLPEVDWWQQFPMVPDYLFLKYNCLSEVDLYQEKRHWPDVVLALFEVTDAALARQLFNQGADLLETFAIAPLRKALGEETRKATLKPDQYMTQTASASGHSAVVEPD